MMLALRQTMGVLLILHLWLLPWVAEAHDPNLATFTLKLNERYWQLQVDTASAAMNRALGGDAGPLTEKRRTEVVRYLIENVHLHVGGTPLVAGPGGVQLGPHQSRVLLNYLAPAHRGELQVHLPAFSEDGSQYNLLRIEAPDGALLHRAMLNPDRNFFASWELPAPTQSPTTPAGFPLTASLLGASAGLLALGLFLGRRSRIPAVSK